MCVEDPFSQIQSHIFFNIYNARNKRNTNTRDWICKKGSSMQIQLINFVNHSFKKAANLKFSYMLKTSFSKSGHKF